MTFMERQVTIKMDWYSIETDQGTCFVPCEDSGNFPNGTAEEYPEHARELAQYCDGKPESWERISGYGARLSAPGYLDCTEWSVFQTEQDAKQYLDEMYPEDEESEL